MATRRAPALVALALGMGSLDAPAQDSPDPTDGLTPKEAPADETETRGDTSGDPEPTLHDLVFDPVDGMLDVSKFLATARGFLPVVGIITEPAVGFGGVVGLLFLHDSLENRAEEAKIRNADGTERRLPPPSISAVAGFMTENDSRGAGLFHLHVFEDDKARYKGAAFYNDVNLDFYGYGGDLGLPLDSISYNLEGGFLLQQMTYRIPGSNFFVGANYKLLRYNASLDLGPELMPPEELPPLESTVTSSGLSLVTEYDTRDTIFTPSAGTNAELEATVYATALGSDSDFSRGSAKYRHWRPMASDLILGLRADAEFSAGDVPFYMLPSVAQRGISRTRYQGEHTLSLEAELRWDFTPRWSLVGFGGLGWVAEGGLDTYDFSDPKPAAGTGFRYLLSKVFGIRGGMDFAWGEDQFALYFTTGTAW